MRRAGSLQEVVLTQACHYISSMLPTAVMISSIDKMSKQLIDDLAERGYSVCIAAVSPALAASLQACSLERSAEFKTAKIGRTGLTSTVAAIRNDEICWLNETTLRTAEIELFALFEDLRIELNRCLFLGLKDFEAHYARYDQGHFYARHLDRFKLNSSSNADRRAGLTNEVKQRVISVVLYLNDHWTESDGGKLILHLSPTVEILPVGGTLVCFTSSEVEHEVQPALRTRTSIAAWFRN